MDIFFGRVNDMKTVLLLSGTSEGPILARMLCQAGFDVRATVTRPEARINLFGELIDRIAVEIGGFTELGLAEYLRQRTIDVVLDATHPFAVRITRLAHAVCAREHVPYVRYERPDWTPPDSTCFVDTFAEAAARIASFGKRIMLTIGAKQLKHFASLHNKCVLFARVLPTPLSIQQALDAGFTNEQILGLRPPFSQEFNRAIFREYQVDVLVTKSSGLEGGVREKVQAACELGIKVLMIRRPVFNDLTVVGSVEAALAACIESASSIPKH